MRVESGLDLHDTESHGLQQNSTKSLCIEDFSQCVPVVRKLNSHA